MGTPDFAVKSLAGLIDAGYDIAGVFTQPDKPKNRGMKLIPTPVKQLAMEHGIPVYQPHTLRDPEALAVLEALAPELIVVAAYGRILPKAVLELPRYGCINVHSSLLPKYRGAAPIQWAILNGEKTTGVTIMHMAEGLDTGDIISQCETPIAPEENAQQLHDRLAALGAKLLCETIPALERGTAQRIPQDDAASCYAPMLSRALSPIDFTRPAQQIHDQVRGLYPWPAASAELGGVTFKICVTEVGEATGQSAGTILGADKRGLNVACGDGRAIRILELQPSGKKQMRAVDYLRGHKLF